jgi:hypothetical protein
MKKENDFDIARIPSPKNIITAPHIGEPYGSGKWFKGLYSSQELDGLDICQRLSSIFYFLGLLNYLFKRKVIIPLSSSLVASNTFILMQNSR